MSGKNSEKKAPVKSSVKTVAKKADKAKVEKAATANDSSKHPTQHEVTIQMTDGTKFNIKTTWGKPGEVLKLDVDPKNHPAWQENSKSFINVNDDRINKFKKKFGDFGAL